VMAISPGNTSDYMAAHQCLAAIPPAREVIADKGYDTKGFVAACRRMCVKPNVVAKVRHSAVDGRTTRHASYAVSQRHASLSMVPSARKVMPFALKRSLAEVSNELIDRPQKVHRWHQIKQMPRIGVLRIAE